MKHAFDPLELLNPGKVIPTLQRCAEYGKMHVHRGMLPFPELAEILMDAQDPALARLDRAACKSRPVAATAAGDSRRRHQDLLRRIRRRASRWT